MSQIADHRAQPWENASIDFKYQSGVWSRYSDGRVYKPVQGTFSGEFGIDPSAESKAQIDYALQVKNGILRYFGYEWDQRLPSLQPTQELIDYYHQIFGIGDAKELRAVPDEVGAIFEVVGPTTGFENVSVVPNAPAVETPEPFVESVELQAPAVWATNRSSSPMNDLPQKPRWRDWLFRNSLARYVSAQRKEMMAQIKQSRENAVTPTSTGPEIPITFVRPESEETPSIANVPEFRDITTADVSELLGEGLVDLYFGSEMNLDNEQIAESSRSRNVPVESARSQEVVSKFDMATTEPFNQDPNGKTSVLGKANGQGVMKIEDAFAAFAYDFFAAQHTGLAL